MTARRLRDLAATARKGFRIASQPAPGPTPEQGHFRAWVPREVAPNGDMIDGHWITVSTTPPALEVLEPMQPMPRAPKTHVGAKSPTQSPAQTPTSQATLPTPLLPSGLLPHDGQGTLRTPRMPLPRALLGGQ